MNSKVALSPGRFSLPIAWLLAVAAFLGAAGPAWSATWIVDDDGGPGVDFTDLPAAIAAAQPGDLLVVRNGQYSGYTLTKGLSIVADTGHNPSIVKYNDVTIRDIRGSEWAVVSGIRMDWYNSMKVQDCEGQVRLDDFSMEGSSFSYALHVVDCELVTLSRCTATASDVSMWGSYPFEEAFRIENSTVIASECNFIGGDGMDEWSDDAYPGTSGVTVHSSTLFLQSSSALGGYGGHVYGIEPYGYGGDGAPGIEIHSSTVELFGLGTHEIRGGAGGFGYDADGDDAPAVELNGGTIAYSGVTFTTYGGKPVFSGSGTVNQVLPDVPVITLQGTGEMGTILRPALYAPVDAKYLLFLSPFSAVYQVGMYTQLLVDPGLLLFVGGGVIHASPATWLLDVPLSPQYQGVPIHFQAHVLLDGGTGQAYLSTSAGFVVR